MYVPTPPGGSIRATQTPEATIVRLAGEIDGSLREEASAAMSLVVGRGAPVELDTSDVTFIDSMGLSFLIQCGAVAHAEGLDVSLPEPPPHVVDLMALVGVDSLFAARR